MSPNQPASKRIANQLKNSTMHLAGALEAGRMGEWRLDLKTKKFFGCRRALEILDLRDQEIDKWILLQASVHVDDRAQLLEGLDESRLTGDAGSRKFRIFDRGGNVRWIQINFFLRDANIKNPRNVTGVVRDISSHMLTAFDLEQSQAEFEKFFEGSRIPMAIHEGSAHRIKRTNPAFDRLVGEYARGKTPAALFPHPHDIELIRHLDRVGDTGDAASVEGLRIDALSNDGVDRKSPVEIGIWPWRDPESKSKNLLCSYVGKTDAPAEDSELLRTTRALTHETHILEAVYQNSPAAMALWCGPNFVIERINSNYQDIFPGRKLLGLPLIEALPEFADHPMHAVLASVLQTGEPYLGTEMPTPVSLTPGGPPTERFYDFSFVRVLAADETPYGVHCHAVDVTERVKARRALESNREKLTLALETANIGFFDRDLVNDVIIMSDRMKLDWQMEGDRPLTSADVAELVHPDDRADREYKIRIAIETKCDYQNCYRVLRADGEYRWMESRGHVAYDGRGRPVRLFGTSVDVTERLAVSRTLSKAKKTAERANVAKSLFLANMSHELRTPLGAIIGFAELLRDPALGDDKRNRFVETVSRSSKALTRIIDDILDLSKVEAGQMQTDFTKTNMTQILQEVVDLFLEEAKSKNLELRFAIDERVPTLIFSDGARIRQILVNLVGNALKFTKDGGVLIHVQSEQSSSDYTDMKINVVDTGPGVPQKLRNKLFKPFSQVDGSSTRQHGGTGLGLALSRSLARLLGGDLIYLSNGDGGSIFQIQFPCQIAPADHSETAQIPSATYRAADLALKGMKVLLAEDSEDNQYLVAQLLIKHGATVEVVNNGNDAVTRAQSEFFDIILMDIQMPGMDGNEATRTLRLDGYTKPIVALTAHAMEEEKFKSKKAGCDAHLTKPLNTDELIHAVYLAGAHLH